MNVKNLSELFEIGLQYANDCETKLVEKGLPSMIEGAHSPELRGALQQHLDETRRHATRLEGIFAECQFEPKTKKNSVISEMLDAGKDSVSNIKDTEVRDAALTANGNMVEHYEIALYGTLAAWARQLGLENAATQLELTLNEEKAADAKLTALANRSANVRAAKGYAAGQI